MNYYQDPSDFCVIFESCKLAGKPECTEYCWKKIQIRYQLNVSGMPADYMFDTRMKKAKSDKDFKQFVELASWVNDRTKLYWRIKQKSEGMFLYSKSKGNGKTSWACKIMLNYLRGLPNTMESFEKPLVQFVSVPSLFDTLRSGMDNPTPELRQLEEIIKTCDLVIFDDIGAESPSKWVKEKLYIYINERSANGRATIFTSNLTIEELEDTLGDRITDRIWGLCRRKYGENWETDKHYNFFSFKDERAR